MVTLASGSSFANALAAKAVSPASSVGTLAEALLATTATITTRKTRGNRISGKQYRFCFGPERRDSASLANTYATFPRASSTKKAPQPTSVRTDLVDHRLSVDCIVDLIRDGTLQAPGPI